MLFSCCAAGRRDSDKSWFVIVVVLVAIQLFTGRSSFSSQFCQCSICILVIFMYMYNTITSRTLIVSPLFVKPRGSCYMYMYTCTLFYSLVKATW